MAAPSDVQYELHVLMISKSKLKSSIRSSTLLAGFAIVSTSEIGIIFNVCVQFDLHPSVAYHLKPEPLKIRI